MSIIKLNVGWTIFETSIDVLKKSDYFKNMFEDCNLNSLSQVLFLDRSPQAFKYVLSYLRDDTCRVPKKYENEFKYFLVKNYMVTDEYDKIEKLCYELKNSIEKIYCLMYF